MKVIKDLHNSHYIRIANFTCNQPQAIKLSKIGIARNVSVGSDYFCIIDLGREVTDEDVVKVRKLLQGS